MPEELNIEQPSVLCIHVWSWFLEISTARSSSGFALNAISYSEIESWSRLSEIKMESWELKLLKKIDLEFINSQHKKG